LDNPRIIKLKKYKDKRGFFKNILDERITKKLGISKDITKYQISISHNKKRVLRGLHYQSPMQNKLIYLLEGKIQDIAVNIDKKSKNYGKSYEFILRKDTDLLYIPKKFAHGFCALEKSTIIYLLDKNYNSNKEVTLDWSDETLNINWKYKNPILSYKDSKGKAFEK
tara:strand:+ start:3348 stop:3848 length:501 start_codon:yes stop_codon:yes gene_type:complete